MDSRANYGWWAKCVVKWYGTVEGVRAFKVGRSTFVVWALYQSLTWASVSLDKWALLSGIIEIVWRFLAWSTAIPISTERLNSSTAFGGRQRTSIYAYCTCTGESWALVWSIRGALAWLDAVLVVVLAGTIRAHNLPRVHAAYLTRAIFIGSTARAIRTSYEINYWPIGQISCTVLKHVALAEHVKAWDAGKVGALSIAWGTNSRTGALSLVPSAFAIIWTLVGKLRSKDFGTVSREGKETELCCVFGHALVFRWAFNHWLGSNSCWSIGIDLGYIVGEIRAALSPVFYKGVLTLAIVRCSWGYDGWATDRGSVHAHVNVRTPLITRQISFIDITALVCHVTCAFDLAACWYTILNSTEERWLDISTTSIVRILTVVVVVSTLGWVVWTLVH